MLDAFVWDSEAEDEWEEEESETGTIAHVVGTLVTHFFFPLVLLMLIYSLLRASTGESWDSITGTHKGNDGNIFISTSYSFIANFLGIFVTVLDTVASPVSSLLRRDEALRELSQNYWTGVFEPALPSYLSQQRKLPIVIGGGCFVRNFGVLHDVAEPEALLDAAGAARAGFLGDRGLLPVALAIYRVLLAA